MARKEKVQAADDYVYRVAFQFDGPGEWELAFLTCDETGDFQTVHPVRAVFKPASPSSSICHRVVAPSARACVESLVEGGMMDKAVAANVLQTLDVLAR